jgi:hypothetical protein
MPTTEYTSLREHYSRFYTQVKEHDSPRESRTRMVRALTDFVLGTEEPITLFNAGSGRREIEGTLVRNAKGNVDKTLRRRLDQATMVTFDIADIPARRIIGERSRHVQADSRAMPFKSHAFDLVMSNLSIDMLRREPGEFEVAIAELSRVTKVGGAVLLNYHPPALFDSLSAGYGEDSGYLAAFYNGEAEDNPYYKDADAIRADLGAVGIEAESVHMQYDSLNQDSWWEVRGRKAA